MQIKTYCCNMENPVGISRPDFSWKVENCKGNFQTAYRIVVYDDGEIIWDTQKIHSQRSCHIEYDGAELRENAKYVWLVTVYTENDEQTSCPATFVTALFDTDRIVWICADCSITSPVFHKTFRLEEVSRNAVVNVCGLGFFELYINGRKVSEDLLNPVRTDYDAVSYKNLAYPFYNVTEKSVQYLTYEVGEYLQAGENSIDVMLGNGWYIQRGRTVEGILDYGEVLKMFLRLTNGSQMVESGTDWLCRQGPVVYNNLFYGETYDARIGQSTTNMENVKKAVPPCGRIVPQLCSGERMQDTFYPSKQGQIYDAGKCMSGFACITCRGKSGDTIRIYYAEKLDEEGELDYTSTVGYVEADQKQIQMDTYILNGGRNETYIPHFVWHSFRYFKIETEGDVDISDVQVWFVSTFLRQRAWFECSDETLNAFHRLATNTLRSNVHGGVPMDCAHRERLGYTGDGQLSSLSVMYNYEAHNFYVKWLDDIIDACNKETGFVPHTAPFNGGGGGPAWGSAIAEIPWNLYCQYGDVSVLGKSRTALQKWIEYLITKSEAGIVTGEEDGSWCLGDWCMPSKYPWSEPHPEEIKLPNELVNTVCLIRCVELYKKMNVIMGLETEPHILRAGQIAGEAVNRVFFKEDHYEGEEQGGDIFPLFVGIVPYKKRAMVSENLVKRITEDSYCFSTGIIGTNYLLRTLNECGRNDVAIKMLCNHQYPGFDYMLKNGATALWETWEGNGSQNHTAFSSADAWLFYGLAGIRPKGGGYKVFTINPYFAPELKYLSVVLECEYGRIGLKWARVKEEIDVEIEVPFNTTAQICLKNRKYVVLCGHYKYRIWENKEGENYCETVSCGRGTIPKIW